MPYKVVLKFQVNGTNTIWLVQLAGLTELVWYSTISGYRVGTRNNNSAWIQLYITPVNKRKSASISININVAFVVVVAFIVKLICNDVFI